MYAVREVAATLVWDSTSEEEEHDVVMQSLLEGQENDRDNDRDSGARKDKKEKKSKKKSKRSSSSSSSCSEEASASEENNCWGLAVYEVRLGVPIGTPTMPSKCLKDFLRQFRRFFPSRSAHAILRNSFKRVPN